MFLMVVEHFPSEGVRCQGVAASYNVPETWNLNKHRLDIIQEIEMYSIKCFEYNNYLVY